jgi:predicted O-linked N-acetylglucosamine transferase (SPINDLY family)
MSFLQAAVGDLEGCLRSLKNARNAEPMNDRVASNLLLRSLGSDKLSGSDLRLLAEAWASRFPQVPCRQDRTLTALRRIGFVSADFRRHPVGYFLAHVIEELCQHVEVFCYSCSPKSDEVTERIRSASAGWRPIHRVSAAEVADSVASDQIDVLIDLAGHTGDNRLDVFALRPAPVQTTWLGYSGTTGLPQIDAILVDDVLVPEGSEGGYTERVARLPQGFLCFEPTTYVPAGQMQKGPVRFGVFNNPAKYSEACFRMWARILTDTEESEIVFKYHNSHDALAQKHVRGALEDLGVAAERVKFAPYLSHRDHLEFLSNVHVALDTYPYSGATTTFDCLWAGVPVVTLAGDRYSARMTASVLSAMGRTQTVAETEDDYVRTAVSLATDPGTLSSARLGLRESLLASPLCNASQFAIDFLETLNGLL